MPTLAEIRVLRSLLACLLTLVMWHSLPVAHSTTITATITADNHYALFYGTDAHLTFVGRNEYGPIGIPSSGQYSNFNWTLPETFTGLSLAESDRLYVAFWDDSLTSAPTAILGQFTTSDGGTLLTNSSEWKFFVTSSPSPGSYGDAPSSIETEGLLASATWTPPGETAPNGTGIWGAFSGGPIPGVSTSAFWLCAMDCGGPTDRLIVYRSVPMRDIQGREIQEFSIPEPGTLALMACTIGFVGWLRHRRNFN